MILRIAVMMLVYMCMASGERQRSGSAIVAIVAEIFNLVLARTGRLLVHQRGVEAFGRIPRNLFDLGGGWQRLDICQVKGAAPEFPGPQAVQFLAESTDAPVLTAQISSAGGCCDVWAATPAWGMWRAHLPAGDAKCGWEHVLPPPDPTDLDFLMAGVTEWVEAAGLPADLPAVRQRLSSTKPRGESWQWVPDLIRALGLPHDGNNLVSPQLDIGDRLFYRAIDALDDAAWVERRWNFDVGSARRTLPHYGERRRLAQDIFDSMYAGGPYTVEQLIDRINDLDHRGGLRH